MRKCANSLESVLNTEKVEKVCHKLIKYAKIRESKTSLENMRKYAKSWESMSKCTKSWESKIKFAKTWKGLRKECNKNWENISEVKKSFYINFEFFW